MKGGNVLRHNIIDRAIKNGCKRLTSMQRECIERELRSAILAVWKIAHARGYDKCLRDEEKAR